MLERTSTSSLYDQIVAHDIVSFDIFDTLMTRAIAQPVDVFSIVKAKLLPTNWALMHANAIGAFPALRIAAERSARENKQRSAGHSEVTFAEIYTALAGISGANEALIAILQQTELATEFELLQTSPDVADLYAFALTQRKRIILCSDMYLPAGEISKFLEKCGYRNYEALFVSAELAASKHAGDLFRVVAERLGVSPARILHIGDNAHGDSAMALRSGWSAGHVRRAHERSAMRGPWNGEPHFAPDTVASVVAGLKRIRANRLDTLTPDPIEELGFGCFGPLFTGFLLWLRVAIEQRHPDRVLLIARDGYFLNTVVRRFLAGLEPAPRCDYLYASRGSLLVAGMTDFSLERLEHLFSGRRRRSLAEHLQRLRLDPHAISTQILAAGFGSTADEVENGDPRMKALLANVHHLVLRESARQRPLVQDYLAPFFDDAREVMLVDVGWTGNVQASIARLVCPIRPEVTTHGYYFGLFPGAASNAIPRHTMRGWLTSFTAPDGFEREFWWSGAVELLESALTAPHGTTLGYERADGGAVRPILEESYDEQQTAAVAERLQRGALAFVDAFLGAYGDVPAESLSSREWAADFYRLVTSPTRDEANLLGVLTHSDSAGETSMRLPLAPIVSGEVGQRAYHEHVYWKSGFVMRNGLEVGEAFSEEFYLMLYDDVRAAVASGAIGSAHEHWQQHGKIEGRSPSGTHWMRQQRKSMLT